jgi:lipopolysaccharide export LptBFGC system permease protein LptF
MKISFVGDVSFTGSFLNKINEEGSNAKVISKDILEILSSSDYTVCNLEGPVTNEKCILSTKLNVKSPPETISLWNLPKFIKIAEQAGFNASRHKTKFHSILAFPFFLSSMLIIAAPFSVRFIRSEKTNSLILSGLLCGLFLYTFANVASAFGSSGSISPLLSAWSPPIIAILLGVSALIYIEEG